MESDRGSTISKCNSIRIQNVNTVYILYFLCWMWCLELYWMNYDHLSEVSENDLKHPGIERVKSQKKFKILCFSIHSFCNNVLVQWIAYFFSFWYSLYFFRNMGKRLFIRYKHKAQKYLECNDVLNIQLHFLALGLSLQRIVF